MRIKFSFLKLKYSVGMGQVSTPKLQVAGFEHLVNMWSSPSMGLTEG